MFSTEQQLRYARHLTLPGFGAEGQQRLLNSSVLLVGAGGLGSPAALYLAAAGVGRIGIVDDDIVDLSNLQRQILHCTRDIGCPKTESAHQALTDRNPDVDVVTIQERFSDANARPLVRDYDLVIDATDNFQTRYLINDAAVLEHKPVVHGSIYLYEGQVTVFHPPAGPCYRCLFPEPPAPGTVPSCAEAGVLGVLPGVIGTLQATEAIKLLSGIGEPLVQRLLSYDALSMRFKSLRIQRRTDCALCGDAPSITDAITIDWFCSQDHDDMLHMTPAQYRQLRKSGEPHLLLDVRETQEVDAGAIEGHIHIPLGELAARAAELAGQESNLIVCLCQAGVRSRKAAAILRDKGFKNIANMEGGYLAWLHPQQEQTNKGES